MSTIQLTRAQRRQMQKLANQVDRVTQADRLFFERFPNRMHRVRLASRAEIEQRELIDGGHTDGRSRLPNFLRSSRRGVANTIHSKNLEG